MLNHQNCPCSAWYAIFLASHFSSLQLSDIAKMQPSWCKEFSDNPILAPASLGLYFKLTLLALKKMESIIDFYQKYSFFSILFRFLIRWWEAEIHWNCEAQNFLSGYLSKNFSEHQNWKHLSKAGFESPSKFIG